MFSVSNILCGHSAGDESLRYSHRPRGGGSAPSTPKPVVVWALTRACNLKCVHCYAAAKADPAPGELTTLQGMELLDDLAAFGVPAVLFSGGEPLRRRDCLTLLDYAVGRGLRVSLSTNGTLITPEVARALRSVGVQYAGISIDGLPAKHDRMRGVVGAFDATIAGLKNCQEAGVRVGLRFTVHALNVDDLDAIFDLAAEHTVERLCIYHLAYAGRGKGMQRVDLAPCQNRDVVKRIFDRTRQLHLQGVPVEVLTVGNHADAALAVLSLERVDPSLARRAEERLARSGGNQSGNFIASIDPLGDVHYDQFSWHYSVGNVKRTPFSRIWSQPQDERLAILRERSDYLPQRCRSCRFVGLCNGNLRTRAEAATGDWLGVDPACYLREEEIHAVAMARA